MEKHLINLTIHTRVEADVNTIVRAQVELRDASAAYVGLGRKGNMYPIQNERSYTHEQLMAFAKEGLLYRECGTISAFAPNVDTDTGLPVLMDEYHAAFRRRQLDNTGKKSATDQLQLNADPQ